MLDSYLTQVYNYFALPPARTEFCNASLAVSQEMALVPAGELDAFAARSLPRIEGAFNAFFQRYEQYRLAAAQWDAEYAPSTLTTTVGVIPIRSTLR